MPLRGSAARLARRHIGRLRLAEATARGAITPGGVPRGHYLRPCTVFVTRATFAAGRTARSWVAARRRVGFSVERGPYTLEAGRGALPSAEAISTWRSRRARMVYRRACCAIAVRRRTRRSFKSI